MDALVRPEQDDARFPWKLRVVSRAVPESGGEADLPSRPAAHQGCVAHSRSSSCIACTPLKLLENPRSLTTGHQFLQDISGAASV